MNSSANADANATTHATHATCAAAVPCEPCVVHNASTPTGLSTPLMLFFSAAVGIIVVDLFAAQPLTGTISASLGLPASLAGLVAMLPQLGYAAGLVLLVPLCDLVENRRLIVRTLAACAALLAVPLFTRSGPLFLVAIFLAGAASSVIQMLVPMAASMAPEHQRGRAVGNVMSGLMVGILLSRPLASVIAGSVSWRGFYGVAAAADALLALLLSLRLPVRRPQAATRYLALLGSLWTLLRTEPVLQRRSLSAALVMGAFSAFWTAIGLRLAQPPFGLDLHGIALFALAGATSAIVTPLAGRAGDRGMGNATLLRGHLAMLVAILAMGVAGAGWLGFAPASHPGLATTLLVASAAALDAGVVIDQTLGRRSINLMNPAARGRLNGIFVGMFFVGGALGAVLSGAAWSLAGWDGVCAVCFVFTDAAFLLGVLKGAD